MRKHAVSGEMGCITIGRRSGNVSCSRSLLLYAGGMGHHGESPTVYRYIDWLITVPLQMVEFYLILFAVGAATSRIFWHLLVGTLVMLLGGYFGEIGVVDATLGFIVGMVGWVYILYFIFAGEAGQKAAAAGGAVASAFSTMRLIVLLVGQSTRSAMFWVT